MSEDPLAYLRGEIPQPSASGPAAAAPTSREGILVMVEAAGQDLTPTSREAVRQALRLASDLGAYVSGFWVGPEAAFMRSVPVGKLFFRKAVESGDPEIEAITSFLRASQFQAVLFGESPWSVRMAPVLSERLERGLLSGLEFVDLDLASGELLGTGSAYGGRMRRQYRLTTPPPHFAVIAKAAEGLLDPAPSEIPIETL